MTRGDRVGRRTTTAAACTRNGVASTSRSARPATTATAANVVETSAARISAAVGRQPAVTVAVTHPPDARTVSPPDA